MAELTDEREAFEKWDRPLSGYRDHDLNGRGEYIDDSTRERWEAWQARAAFSATGAEDAEPAGYFLRAGFSPDGEGTRLWQQVGDEMKDFADVVPLYTTPKAVNDALLELLDVWEEQAVLLRRCSADLSTGFYNKGMAAGIRQCAEKMRELVSIDAARTQSSNAAGGGEVSHGE